MQTKWLLTTATVLALVASPAFAANDSITKAMKNSQSTGAKTETPGQSGDASAESPAASPSQSSPDRSASDEGASDQASSGKSLDRSSGRDASQSARNDEGSNGWHRNARAMTQHKLRHALKKAGFTHIRVLDAKYLVQAKDNDGNTVFMAINPPSMGKNDETTGYNGNAGADERSGASRDDEMDSADNADSNGYDDEHGGQYRGANARGGRNNGGQLYDRGYDQGFREGYARGFNRGYGN